MVLKSWDVFDVFVLKNSPPPGLLGLVVHGKRQDYCDPSEENPLCLKHAEEKRLLNCKLWP